ncbi:MAG: crossover junction endodeoxyribonuclease RuvC [Deltaproteobacteria bacterium]|nr:crossover junction endodeoxyribonuclease RuvC [Deltaproteobacteria bacterium]MBW1948475.1 crossover junction endodeoxyribonuclease RuvC [Deltaproteobacteria bacterium]MBW2007487.1 crossover junction endodeoxyribonuclease RuvC [Deltaproteobacteria bacterium]MBW2348093.1 crossover junction endodeoxyribonuclease RuvC [Deltaproteobacteria bacterium]
MRVLGVDPGSRITGYGIVEKSERMLRCVRSGQIKTRKGAPFPEKIHQIFQGIRDLIETYHPRQMAIEDIFYAKNVKSSLKLGHARGAALVAATEAGLDIYEYTPLEIKKAVVGYGRASKEQVGAMVRVILKLDAVPGPDAADALAAAICHLNWIRLDPRQARGEAPTGEVSGSNTQ